MLKKCTKCKIEKEISEFYKCKSRKDGLQFHCKKCSLETAKLWQENNRDRANLSCKKWREKDIVKKDSVSKKWAKNNVIKKRYWYRRWAKNNPDKVKKRGIEYRKNNSERVRKIHNEWCKNNPEKAKARNNRWRKNNPEKTAELSRRYSLRKIYRTPPDYIPEFGRLFYRMAQRMSKVMGEPYHVDHIIPLQPRDKSITPGLHHQNNLQVMRGSENIKKGNKIIY